MSLEFRRYKFGDTHRRVIRILVKMLFKTMRQNEIIKEGGLSHREEKKTKK